jgi:hypothetical protein
MTMGLWIEAEWANTRTDLVTCQEQSRREIFSRAKVSDGGYQVEDEE